MSSAPKSQVLKLANLVAYQDGSVVSRQITKAEAGNVTLFAFDAGQELSEHSTPFDALVHCFVLFDFRRSNPPRCAHFWR